jgi:hypothetical protein
MEKVFLRIAGGEEGLAQSRLGREIAEMLQAEADDEAQRELDKVVFSEATCCGCTRFAWLHLGLYTLFWHGVLTFFWMMGNYAQDRFEWCLWSHNNRSKGSLKRCARREFWIKAGTMPVLCVEINRCVGCARQFFTKSYLGDDAAVLARSSGEEPASPRTRRKFDFHTGSTTRRWA